MSDSQTMALSDPTTAALAMAQGPAAFWIGAGEKHALEVFHATATKVASYRDFLEEHGLDHTTVQDIETFRELVPLSDRKSHFTGNSMDRLLAGDVTDAHMFFMSGGSTGDSLVGATDRATMEGYPFAFSTLFQAQWGVFDPGRRVMLVNALSLGSWVAGMMTSSIFASISAQHDNVAYTLPGADAPRILDLLDTVGTHFDMSVIVSYPTFIAELVREGRRRGMDLPALGIKFVVVGERLSLELRDEIVSAISSPPDPYTILNQYAASDMGTPGVETPIATLITRLAREHPALCKDVFGRDTPRQLLQNNPLGTYVEIVDGHIIGTYGGLMPVVRYSPKDTGSFLGFDEMIELLAGYGIDAASMLAADGWNGPVIRWPFLVLGSRADDAVSIYGAKISPQSIEDLFVADARVSGFALSTVDEGEFSTLRLHIELAEGASLDDRQRLELCENHRRAVLERLLDVNFDYRDAWNMREEAMVPRVELHEHARGPFKPRENSLKPHARG